jgi:hypothetical protein
MGSGLYSPFCRVSHFPFFEAYSPPSHYMCRRFSLSGLCCWRSRARFLHCYWRSCGQMGPVCTCIAPDRGVAFVEGHSHDVRENFLIKWKVATELSGVFLRLFVSFCGIIAMPFSLTKVFPPYDHSSVHHPFQNITTLLGYPEMTVTS